MKNQLILFVLTIWSLNLYPQEKASLTKDETVNYIKKKIVDINDYYTDTSNSNSTTYKDIRFTLNESKVYISYEIALKAYGWCNGYSLIYTYSYVFDASQITEIEEIKSSGNNSVSFLKLSFANKIVNYDYSQKGCNFDNNRIQVENSTSENINTATIPFVSADPSTFNKLKKAIEYLRDLLKAEDDPFGN